ncbi:hypothetical protein ACG7TL_002423 [Trametes sanguinea]
MQTVEQRTERGFSQTNVGGDVMYYLVIGFMGPQRGLWIENSSLSPLQLRRAACASTPLNLIEPASLYRPAAFGGVLPRRTFSGLHQKDRKAGMRIPSEGLRDGALFPRSGSGASMLEKSQEEGYYEPGWSQDMSVQPCSDNHCAVLQFNFQNAMHLVPLRSKQRRASLLSDEDPASVESPDWDPRSMILIRWPNALIWEKNGGFGPASQTHRGCPYFLATIRSCLPVRTKERTLIAPKMRRELKIVGYIT